MTVYDFSNQEIKIISVSEIKGYNLLEYTDYFYLFPFVKCPKLMLANKVLNIFLVVKKVLWVKGA